MFSYYINLQEGESTEVKMMQETMFLIRKTDTTGRFKIFLFI